MVAGRPALPTGVVTFLLTDIEGSTALWDRHPDGMRRAVEQHDALFEQLVDTAGGTLLKARGEGDSTFSVFQRPTGAVSAALEVRRAIAAADWPDGCRPDVRFAVHLGEVSEREGDYYGSAVNRAGRLRSLAVGGQILVSQAVTELVADHLPPHASLVDLGEQELRGLSRPERIWALVDGSRPVREALGGLCPYKGLLAFQPEDDDVYFGRDDLIAAVLARLVESRLLVVVGASGSGKSSLVRAGVVGALHRGALPGSAAWRVDIVTPGESPLARLGGSLDGGGRVLVIDQMEELFTLCRDAEERERFVAAVLGGVDREEGRLLVVAALRADFYGHCASVAGFAPVLSDATLLLGPMDDDALAQAIEGPAEVAGLRLEPGLVEVVLRDLAREPGSLPLLSHALLETWRRRSGRTLTVAGYEDSGGVRGAIARTAETVWNDELTPSQRPVVRRTFLRLTELGEGTEDTRRRVSRTELVSGADVEATDDVVAALADARLVTVDDGTVEVAHEALIREWPRLRRWLDEDRDALRIHRHLTHAAADWNGLGRDAAELYRGPRLAAVREWLAREDDAALNDLEADFLRASSALEDEQRRAAEERYRARERANRRLRRMLVGTAIALVVAIVAVIVAAGQRERADDQARSARAATVSAEVDRIVAEVPTLVGRDRTLAALLAAEAVRLRPDPATRGALLETLIAAPGWRGTRYGGQEGYAWAAPFPDRRRAAIAGREGVDVWDLATGRRTAGVSVPGAAGVAVRPDGGQVAVGNGDGRVTFLDPDRLEPGGQALDVGQRVADLAYRPDGSVVAVAVGRVEGTDPVNPGSTPRLWDVASGRPVGAPLDGHSGTSNTVAFSPAGGLVATGGNDGLVVLHDAGTGALVATLPALDGPIYGLAFSPDGGLLVATGVHGTGRVFDVATRRPRGAPLTGMGELPGAAFAADGRRFVTTGETTQLWDAGTVQRVGDGIDAQHGPPKALFDASGRLVLTGFDGTVTSWEPDGVPTIARAVPGVPPGGGTFSPDGSLLAVPGHDDTVVLLRTEGVEVVATLSAGPPGQRPLVLGATAAAFSSDGRTVAVGHRTGAVQTYDTATGRARDAPLDSGLPGGVASLTFTPDDRRIVATSTAEADNGVRILDPAERTVEAIEPPFPYALSASFSPDGGQLVLTSGAGGAAAYPVTRGSTIGKGERLEELGAQAETAAFSPDGALLAIGTQNGKVQLYDRKTLRPRGGPVAVSNGILATLAFDGDGGLLAVQDDSLAIHLVDVEAGAPIGEPFAGNAGGFGVVDFSPDGRTMVAPGPAGTTIWDLDPAGWRRAACDLAGRDLSGAEWDRYLGATDEDRRPCN